MLNNGLGAVPFSVDIRDAITDEPVYTTEVNQLIFPNRTMIVQMALTIEAIEFPRPGLYTVELVCNNQWLADTTLLLK